MCCAHLNLNRGRKYIPATTYGERGLHPPFKWSSGLSRVVGLLSWHDVPCDATPCSVRKPLHDSIAVHFGDGQGVAKKPADSEARARLPRAIARAIPSPTGLLARDSPHPREPGIAQRHLPLAPTKTRSTPAAGGSPREEVTGHQRRIPGSDQLQYRVMSTPLPLGTIRWCIRRTG